MGLTRYFFYVIRSTAYALLQGVLGLLAGMLVVCRLIDLTFPLHRRFEKNLFQEEEKGQHGDHLGG